MTNIFKELKNSKGIFDDLDKNTLRSVIKSFNNTSMSVDDLAQKFGGLNTETISYLKSAKRGEASLEGLSASMTSASISTKLLSVALNALSGLAISLLIKGFTWALDELIVTLDEQKQKLDEAVTAYEESKSELEQINDELKTTGERIDELNGKENLTFTEQDELEKLIKTNDELERKIYLLEQANKEAEKEVATEAQNTYDKYTNDRIIGAVEQIDFYADSSLLEGVSWDNFKGDLSWLVAQYKNQQEILTNAQANGWTQIEEQTKSNLELLEGYMSDASLDYQDLYDKISGISDYAMTDELKVAKQDLDDILDIVAEILGYGGQRSETTFDSIWNSEDFSQYKTELETLAKEGKLDASVLESNENYKKLLDDTGTTAEDTAQHINALVDEIGKTGQEANKIDVSNIFKLENTTLGKLSESIDKIQNAYKTLYSAIEEYNSEGAISVDTLQSVIALGDDWLDYLVDEQGNLKLDQQALQNLTASRLNDMRVQAINDVIDNASKVNDEVSAKEYLTSTNYALAESYEELAEKKLEDLRVSLAGKGLDSGVIDNVVNKASADISKINKLFNNTNISSSSIIGNSSSSKSEKKWKDYLDKLLSSYEAELELGLIDFENFTDKSFALVEKFYREGKITAEEYWDAINQLYERQLNIYDKVISAVTRRIDKEIEGIEDIIDGLEYQNDVLEKQLDDYDGILSAVEEVYDNEIERLEDEKDLLQDKIDALNDEADAYELVRKKEEALYALEQAQQNRTKKLYVEGKGYIYDQDRDAVREAQDNLYDIEIEEVVNKLEKEQEALDESIKVLEEYKAKWVEISDAYEKEINKQLAIALWGENYESIILQNRVSYIDAFKTQYLAIQAKIDDNQSLIDSYNEKIEYYNGLKDQWNEIADVYEQSVEDQYASMILGQDWEKQILDERSLKLNEFKEGYVGIQEAIAQAALDSATKQAEAAKISSDAIDTLIANKTAATALETLEESSVATDDTSSTKYRIVTYNGDVLQDDIPEEFLSTAELFVREVIRPGVAFKVEAYSKGGVIGKEKSNLDYIAQQVGEDRVITAKEGERVLTPIQNDMWEKWTKALPNLQEFAKTINFMPNIKLPDYSHLSSMVQRQQQPIVQNFNITMPNVTNSTSADRIMRDLQRLPLDAYQYSRRR